MYKASTAHKVSKASARKIQDALNNASYHIKSGERWHTYDVSEWDSAYDFAQFQAFQIRKGKLIEVS